MQPMLTFPAMVFIILFTAVLSSIVTTALPHMGKWLKSFKLRIKRNSTPTNIQKQIDDLQSQIDNLVEVKYNRDTNRRNNIKRDVREYLGELQND